MSDLDPRGWVRPTRIGGYQIATYIALHGLGQIGYEQDYEAAYRGSAEAAARLDALADTLAMERLRGQR